MTHTEDELFFASKYFVFHLRMYAETFIWIFEYQEKPTKWDTVRNAILIDHLVHARVLISFFFPGNRQIDDVIANDYIYCDPENNYKNNCVYLKNQAKIIGGQLVHLTTKQIPDLMSEKGWPIPEIKNQLIEVIDWFIRIGPNNKMSEEIKTQSQNIILNLPSKFQINGIAPSS